MPITDFNTKSKPSLSTGTDFSIPHLLGVNISQFLIIKFTPFGGHPHGLIECPLALAPMVESAPGESEPVPFSEHVELWDTPVREIASTGRRRSPNAAAAPCFDGPCFSLAGMSHTTHQHAPRKRLVLTPLVLTLPREPVPGGR